MKRLFLLIIIFLSHTVLSAQSIDKEVFQHSTLSKAKRSAQLSGKYIFVFAYTDWSIPSMRMIDDAFIDTLTVEALRKNYECVSINAVRKKKFASKYEVNVFPSLFIMDKNENVILRTSGYHSPTDVISLLNKSRNNNRYLKQNLDSLALISDRHSIIANIDSTKLHRDEYSAKNLVKMYLDKKSTDWRDPVSMSLIKDNFQLDKKYLKFISKYHFKFFERFDSISIKENIAFHVFVNSLDTNGRGRPKFEYKPVKKWFKKHRILGADKLENFVKIKYLLWGRGPSINYSVNLIKYYPETSNENVLFASVIRLLLSESRRTIDYDELISSLRSTIKEDGTFWRYDCLSLLYYKTGNDYMSDKMIQTAQQVADVLGKEYEPTLDFIKEDIIR